MGVFVIINLIELDIAFLVWVLYFTFGNLGFGRIWLEMEEFEQNKGFDSLVFLFVEFILEELYLHSSSLIQWQ